MASGNDLEIAPGFRASQWRALNLTNLLDPALPDWRKAILVFDTRIRTRFIDPVDALIAADATRKPKTFGFAILAIDCLLIEALQAFRRGIRNHTRHSTKLITGFLKTWDAFGSCLKPGDDPALLAKRFYEDVRCELHHAGATGDRIRVRITGPTFNFVGSGMEINRTLLHEELVKAFDAYLNDLRDPTKTGLRAKFQRKMAHVAR